MGSTAVVIIVITELLLVSLGLLLLLWLMGRKQRKQQQTAAITLAESSKASSDDYVKNSTEWLTQLRVDAEQQAAHVESLGRARQAIIQDLATALMQRDWVRLKTCYASIDALCHSYHAITVPQAEQGTEDDAPTIDPDELVKLEKQNQRLREQNHRVLEVMNDFYREYAQRHNMPLPENELTIQELLDHFQQHQQALQEQDIPDGVDEADIPELPVDDLLNDEAAASDAAVDEAAIDEETADAIVQEATGEAEPTPVAEEALSAELEAVPGDVTMTELAAAAEDMDSALDEAVVEDETLLADLDDAVDDIDMQEILDEAAQTEQELAASDAEPAPAPAEDENPEVLSQNDLDAILDDTALDESDIVELADATREIAIDDGELDLEADIKDALTDPTITEAGPDMEFPELDDILLDVDDIEGVKK